MSSTLYALGRWAFRARVLVIVGWLALLTAAGGAAVVSSVGTDNTFVIPGTESQDALDALARTFPQVSGTSAQLVVVVPEPSSVRDPEVRAAVEAAIDEIGALPEVGWVTSPYAGDSTPYVSADGAAALVPVQLSGAATAVPPPTSDAVQQAGSDLLTALPEGSQVAVGGQLVAQETAGVSITGLLGIAVAFVVLLVTFGAVAAAGLPLVTALGGTGVSLSIVLAGTAVLPISSTTPLLALLLGLALGIDYGLFIVARHRELLRDGEPPQEAAARALATAGPAVVLAATAVIAALLALAFAGIPFLTTMGVAAALAVAIAVLGSLTLTPALLGLVGWHAVRRRDRPVRKEDADAAPDAERDPSDGLSAVAPETPTAEAPEAGGAGGEFIAPDAPAGEPVAPVDDTLSPAALATAESADDRPRRRFFSAWVRVVTHWPAVTVVLVVATLAFAAVPAAHLRLALPDEGFLDRGAPARETYDLVAQHFGPGFTGPLLLTGSVIQSTDPVGLMDDIAANLADVPGVAAVPLATPNDAGDTGIVQVIPEEAPDSDATKDLVTELRAMHDEVKAQFGVDLAVTGRTAVGIDVSDRLAGALVPFGIFVVVLLLVLLAMVFRSIVVPVAAAAGSVLSIGAALGLTSLVFVDGVLAGPLNVARVGSVISFMPIILMCVLLGLAMLFEVSLVSRMRDHQVRTGDTAGAVHAGFVASAPVVTAAAIITIAVFAAFVPEGDAAIQQIAFGLAVGVAIDTFVVRMTLIPAVLRLFGAAAWRMPRVLQRVLPSVDVEGEGAATEIALASWPSPLAPALAAERAEIPGAGTFDVVAGPGEVVIVHGADAQARTAVVLTLCARRTVRGGRLKVAGFVLPARTGAVRRRSAYVHLWWEDGPLALLADAFATRPRVVVLDGLDEITDPELCTAIASSIAATMFWSTPPCFVVSVRERAAAGALLPAGMPQHPLAVLSIVAEV